MAQPYSYTPSPSFAKLLEDTRNTSEEAAYLNAVGASVSNASERIGQAAAQARRQDMANAAERNRQRIAAGIRDELEIKPAQTTNPYLDSISGLERYNNYRNGSIQDPELDYDLRNRDLNYLAARYGNDLTARVAQDREQSMSRGLDQVESKGDLSYSDLADLAVIGANKGAYDIQDAFTSAGILMSKDGTDRTKAFQDLEAEQKSRNESLDSITSAGQRVSAYNNRGNENLADKYRNAIRESLVQGGYSDETVKRTSESLGNEYHDALTDGSTGTLAEQVGTQVPQMGLAIAAAPIGGLAGSMAVAGGLGGLMDGTGSNREAYLSVVEHFSKMSPSEQQAAFAKSDVVQEFLAQNPNATHDQVIAAIATDAGNSAGLTSGLFTGLTSAASAGFTAAPFARALMPSGKGAMSLAQRGVLGTGGVAAEGIEEGAQEFVNQVSTRSSVNDATGDQVYDDPSRYAWNNSKAAAVVGTAMGAPSTVAGAAQGTVEATKYAAGKAKPLWGKYAQSVRERADKARSASQTTVDTETTQAFNDDLNVMYTRAGMMGDNQGNAGVTGQTVDESAFGQTYTELREELGSILGKNAEQTANYGETVRDLYVQSSKLVEELSKAEASGSDTTKIKSDLKRNLEVRRQLWDSLTKDLMENTTISPEVLADPLRTTELTTQAEQVYSTGTSPEDSMAKYEAFKASLPESDQAILDGMWKLSSDPVATKVVSSPLYLQLSQSLGRNLNTVESPIKIAKPIKRGTVSFNDVLFNTGTTTTAQLYKALDKANNKTDAENSFMTWMDAVSKVDVGNILRNTSANDKLKSFQSRFKEMHDKAVEKGVNIAPDSFVGIISDLVLNTDFSDWNANSSATFLDKFVGSRGVLGYLVQAQDAGVSATQLMKFKQSQDNKMAALLKALKDAEVTEDGKLLNPEGGVGITVDLNRGFGTPYNLKRMDGKDVTFNSQPALLKYIDKLKNEHQVFDNLITRLLQAQLSQLNTDTNQETVNLSETASESRQKASTPKENTEAKAEPKTQSESNTEPVNRLSEGEHVQRIFKAKDLKSATSYANAAIKAGVDKKVIDDAVKAYKDNAERNAKATKPEVKNEEPKTINEAKPENPVEVPKDERVETGTKQEEVETLEPEPTTTEPVEAEAKSNSPINSETRRKLYGRAVQLAVGKAIQKLGSWQERLAKETSTTGKERIENAVREQSEFLAQWGIDPDKEVKSTPQETIDNLYQLGLNTKYGVIENYTNYKLSDTAAEERAGKMVERAKNFIKKEFGTDEEITEYLKVVNPTVTDKRVAEMLQKTHRKDLESVLSAHAQKVVQAEAYLNNPESDVLYQLLNNVESNSFFNPLIRMNAVMDLKEYDETGKPYPSNRLVMAFGTTAFQYDVDAQNNGVVDSDMVLEALNKIGIVSNVHDRTPWHRTSFTVVNKKDGSKEWRLVKRNEIEIVSPDLGNLGVHASRSSRELGQDFMHSIGMNFKKETPKNLVENVTQVFGNEVRAMLVSMGTIVPKSVQIEKEDGSIIPMAYDNHIFNEASLHKTLPSMPRELLQAMHQLRHSKDGSTEQLNAVRYIVSYDKQNRTNLAASATTKAFAKSDVYKGLFDNSKERLGFKVFSIKDTDSDVKPTTPTNAHGSDKILHNLPENLRQNLEDHNAVAYRIAPEMIRWLREDPETLKVMMGYVELADIDGQGYQLKDKFKGKHKLELETIAARNNAIDRNLNALQDLVAEADEKGIPLEDLRVYLTHELTETVRTQQAGKLRPQADKFLREILITDKSSFREVENGKETRVFQEYDLGQLSGMVRPVTSSVEHKLPEPKYIQDTRTIQDLVDAIETTTNPDEKEFLDGLLLGLAQAVGIKIERKNRNQIIKDLQTEVEGKRPDMYFGVMNALYDYANGESLTSVDREALAEFGEAFGSKTAPRAISALMAYAKWTLGETGSTFDYDLYLETDGIGNGFSNLANQFTGYFSARYFDSMERVGVSSLGYLANNAIEYFGLDNYESLASVSEDKWKEFMQQYEGSAELLSGTDFNAPVRDIYQNLGDFVAREMSTTLSGFMSNGVDGLGAGYAEALRQALRKDGYDENLFGLAKVFNPFSDFDPFKKVFSRMQATLRAYMQANITNSISTIDTDKHLSEMADFMLTPLKDFTAEDVHKFHVEVTRALAKMALTPALYGGKLNGITQQVAKDTGDAWMGKWLGLFEKMNKDGIKYDVPVRGKITPTIGIALSEKNVNTLLLTASSISDSGATQMLLNAPKVNGKRILTYGALNSYLLNFPKGKKSIHSALLFGLGRVLQETTTNAYGDVFATAENAFYFDDLAVAQFSLDLQKAIEQAVADRNDRMGYEKNDPRRNDAIGKNEINAIVRSLPNIPVIGNAFSSGSRSTENLLREGHTITKQIRSEERGLTVGSTMGIEGMGNSSSVLANNIYRDLRLYKSGGATNLTNTVVSTEAVTQAAIAGVLRAFDGGQLDVFDGADSPAQLKKLVGTVANESFRQVHENTNLLEEMHHRFVRSGISNKIKASRKKFLQFNSEIRNAGADGQVEVRGDELMLFAQIMSLADREAYPSMNTALAVFDQSVEVIIQRGTEPFPVSLEHVKVLSDSEAVDAFEKAVEKLDRYTANLAGDVAGAYARKEVSKKFLVSNFNQFAGANRGVFQNPEQLFKDGSVVKRFFEYVGKQAQSGKSMNQILSDFLVNDSEIAAYAEKRAQDKLGEILYPELEEHFTISNGSTVRDVLEGKEFSSQSSKFIKDLVMNPLMEKVQNMEIITDFEEFQTWIKSEGYDLDKETLSDISGIYLPNASRQAIYINNRLSNTAETLAHELAHAMTHQAVFEKYENKGATLSPTAHQALTVIEANARSYAQQFANNPSVKEAVKHAKQFNTVDIHNTNSDKNIGTAASILHAFSTDDVGLKTKAISEWIAYAHTNPDVLNTTQYMDVPKEVTGTIWKKVKDYFRETMKKVRDLVAPSITDETLFANHKLGKNMYWQNMAAMYDLTHNKQFIEPKTQRKGKGKGKRTNHAEPVHEPLYSIGSLNPTEKYKAMLNMLRTEAENNGVIATLPEEWTNEFYTNLQNEVKANSPVQALRNSGLTVTQSDSDFIDYLTLVNDLAFNQSPTMRNEAEKLFNTVYQEITKTNMPAEQIKAALGSGSIGQKLAVVTSVPEVNRYFKEAMDKRAQTKTSKVLDWVTDNTLFKEAGKELVEFTDIDTLDKLAVATVKIDMSNMQTKQRQEQLAKDNLQKTLRRHSYVNQVNKLNGVIPDTAYNVISAASTDFLLAEDTERRGDDGTIASLLTDIMDYRRLTKGEQDWVSKVLRWFVGATRATQEIYGMRSQFASKVEAARETQRAIVPNNVHQAFNGKFTAEMDSVIADTVIPTVLSNLYDSDLNRISKVLGSEKARLSEIAAVEKRVEALVKGLVPQNQVQPVMNYLKWQTEGLGSTMVTRTAKAATATGSHHILPNARTIASLAHTGLKVNTIEAMQALSPVLKELATLHSLAHVSAERKQALVDMIQNHEAGVTEVMLAQQSIERDFAKFGGTTTHLGMDGLVYGQFDPNIDIKLVPASAKVSQGVLPALGYIHEATLPNGMKVYRTDTNVSRRTQSGIFGNTDFTTFGMNNVTNQPISGFYETHGEVQAFSQTAKEFRAAVAHAMRVPNYYSSLVHEGNSTRPVINTEGELRGFTVDLPKELQNSLVQQVETGIESLGNLRGRFFEENAVFELNRKNLAKLNEIYESDSKKANYVKFDGDMKPSKLVDANRARELNQMYNRLPAELKNLIKGQGGVWLHHGELDNILGYQHLDITDLITGNVPAPLKQAVISGINLLSNAGFNPIKYMRMGQQGWQEMVALTKDYMLVRSIKVAVSNLVSNFVHLWNRGIPAKNIPSDVKEGLVFAKNYQRNQLILDTLRYRRDNHKLSDKEVAMVDAEIQFLEEALATNPVKPLMDAGLLSSITGQAKMEIGYDAKDAFSLQSRLERKLLGSSIGELISTARDSRTGKIASNVLLTKDSEAHQWLEQSVDYGDFVGKYALYKHLTQRLGYDSNRAVQIARDEFVNYAMNRGAGFDYANTMGMAWFLSYASSVQRIIHRLLKVNPSRTLAVIAGGEVSQGMIEIVPAQNLFNKNWDYAFSPSNALDTYSNHYLITLLKNIF